MLNIQMVCYILKDENNVIKYIKKYKLTYFISFFSKVWDSIILFIVNKCKVSHWAM